MRLRTGKHERHLGSLWRLRGEHSSNSQGFLFEIFPVLGRLLQVLSYHDHPGKRRLFIFAVIDLLVTIVEHLHDVALRCQVIELFRILKIDLEIDRLVGCE